jgi:hypothetical protein
MGTEIKFLEFLNFFISNNKKSNLNLNEPIRKWYIATTHQPPIAPIAQALSIK